MIEVFDYRSVSQLDLEAFVFINNRHTEDPSSVFFCYLEDDKLLGVLKLNVGVISWFSYIEVVPECRQKGIATALMTYLFIYCRSHRLKTISVSHFTHQGALSVKHVMNRFSKVYGITVIMD
jgi:GNAT superfamily N-acetyltransferase